VKLNDENNTGIHYFLKLDETTAAGTHTHTHTHTHIDTLILTYTHTHTSGIKRLANLEELDLFDREIGTAAVGEEAEMGDALGTCSSIFNNAALKDWGKRILIITNQAST
jgi:hypothetical protein